MLVAPGSSLKWTLTKCLINTEEFRAKKKKRRRRRYGNSINVALLIIQRATIYLYIARFVLF